MRGSGEGVDDGGIPRVPRGIARGHEAQEQREREQVGGDEDEFEGDRFSHACPFARVMENHLADRLVQVGIRTLTPHLRAQAERFGVEVIDMHAFASGQRPEVDGPVYLSLDLDALDPAFAPGVSHWEPGGLTTRDVITIIQSLGGRLIGADVVEYNPVRDPSGVTAMVAAKLVKEIASRMLEE